MQTDSFFNQALKGQKEWVLYLATIVLVFLAHIIGAIFIFLPAMIQMSKGVISSDDFNNFLTTTDISILKIPSFVGLICLLMSFVLSMIALWACAKLIHQRLFVSMITSFEQIRWSRIKFSFLVWFSFTLIAEAGLYILNPAIYEFRFDFLTFLPLLLVSIFILPIQTSFEEIMLRGYTLQGMSLWAKWRIIPIILTSLIFAALHLANPEVKEFGLGVMATYYLSVAIFLAVLTVMDEGLELALGVHAATNIYGATMVTFKGSALQTDALFTASEINAPLMLLIFVVSAITFAFIAKRKYKWPSFNKIFGRIERPIYQTIESEIL